MDGLILVVAAEDKIGGTTLETEQIMKKKPLIPCNIIARIQNIVACFEVKRTKKVTVRVREKNRVCPKAILLQRWFT